MDSGPLTYAKVLGINLAVARRRLDLSQEDVAERMRDLGYAAWTRATVSKSERGTRPVTAEEILGLAYALHTTVERLMTPQPEDRLIGLASGEPLPWQSVRFTVSGGDPSGEEPARRDRNVSFYRGLRWDGNTLVRVPTRYETDWED